MSESCGQKLSTAFPRWSLNRERQKEATYELEV